MHIKIIKAPTYCWYHGHIGKVFEIVSSLNKDGGSYTILVNDNLGYLRSVRIEDAEIVTNISKPITVQASNLILLLAFLKEIEEQDREVLSHTFNAKINRSSIKQNLAILTDALQSITDK